jgi:hypothetical protein
MPRSFEIALGAVASVIASIGLGFVIFGPATFSYGPNRMSAASTSIWDQGITTNVLNFLTAMILAAVGIGIGTYLRTGGGQGTAVALLWTSFAVLLIGALVTLPGDTTAVVPSALHTSVADSLGVGVYLLPGAFTAFVAALIETVAHHRPGRPMTTMSH